MNFLSDFWNGLTGGLKGGVKSLTGNYTPEEKKAIKGNLQRAQTKDTSLGEAVQIVGKRAGIGNEFNLILIALIGLVALQILD